MHILYLQHSSIQTDHISCAQWLHVAHGSHSEQQLIEGVNRIHSYNLRQVEVISSCPWTNGQWIHVGSINCIAFRHGKFILKLWISGLSKWAQQLLHITTCGYWNKHFHILPHLIFSKKNSWWRIIIEIETVDLCPISISPFSFAFLKGREWNAKCCISQTPWKLGFSMWFRVNQIHICETWRLELRQRLHLVGGTGAELSTTELNRHAIVQSPLMNIEKQSPRDPCCWDRLEQIQHGEAVAILAASF